MQNETEYPALRLSHLRTLTNNSGIIQHGWYTMPNEITGYCTDDNCRAFLVAVQAYRRHPEPELLRLMSIYLSFIRAAHNDRGTFRNFMSYQQYFLDEEGSEDCQGRVLWSLGYALRFPPHEQVAAICKRLFEPSFTWLPDLHSTRGRAYSILGLRNYHLAFPNDPRVLQTLSCLAEMLAEKFESYATEAWPWFDGRLTYANGIPPMSMLLAGEVLHKQRFIDIGLRTLDWLNTIVVRNDIHSPVGCIGWYDKGHEKHDWDQQPIDPAGMVGACLTAYRVTQDKGYAHLARTCYDWFHGANMLRASLVDAVAGACADGLTENGVNGNCGAESSLVYYLASMCFRRDEPISL